MSIQSLASNILSLLNTKPQPLTEEFRKLPDGVYFFNASEHHSYAETRTHFRYNCPYCPDVRGKPDRDGKFYFDKTKLVGFCHKCQSVGVSTELGDLNVELQVRIDAAREALTSIELRELSEIKYDQLFDDLDEEGKKYLDSRFPVYSHLKEFFEFRVSPHTGIAVPTYVNGKINSYSLRFYQPTGKMKYFIPKGAKSIYSPNRIFGRKSGVTITLVEGYFDAIAALMLGEENPLAVFGLYLTDEQVRLIRSVLPQKIVIFLDNTKLSWTMKRNIQGLFPMCTEIEIRTTYNKDPEDILREKLDYSKRGNSLEEFITSCVNNVRNS